MESITRLAITSGVNIYAAMVMAGRNLILMIFHHHLSGGTEPADRFSFDQSEEIALILFIRIGKTHEQVCSQIRVARSKIRSVLAPGSRVEGDKLWREAGMNVFVVAAVEVCTKTFGVAYRECADATPWWYDRIGDCGERILLCHGENRQTGRQCLRDPTFCP